MLICDIDGTLTDENYTLHPGIPVAFRKMEELGIPVALATAIGKSIITAAGAVTDATNINQKLVILEGETDEDDVVDNEDEWMINDIFTHENMLVKDPQKQTVRDETRENGEKCYCPDWFQRGSCTCTFGFHKSWRCCPSSRPRISSI